MSKENFESVATAIMDQEWTEGVDWFGEMEPEDVVMLSNVLADADDDVLAKFISSDVDILNLIRGLSILSIKELAFRYGMRLKEEDDDGPRNR